MTSNSTLNIIKFSSFFGLQKGLGNQLFQYAAAYSIAEKRNSDIYICVNGYDVKLKSFIPSYYSSEQRKYSLDQFNVPQDKLLYWYPTANFKWNQFDVAQCGIEYYLNGRKIDSVVVNEVNVLNGNLPDDKVLLVKDLFESEIFFAAVKQNILNKFQPTFDTLPIAHLMELVSSTQNSVSVHVRRGDMANRNDFRLISIRYQKEAMQLLKQKLNTGNVTFFIFTDDLNYVKKHLEEVDDVEPSNIIYMSEHTKDNTLYDFLLMSMCQHNIIPNSSFSWWAAYLNRNPNKIVVAPMPKYKTEWIAEHYKSQHSKRLLGELAYPKDWLTLKPTFLNYSDV